MVWSGVVRICAFDLDVVQTELDLSSDVLEVVFCPLEGRREFQIRQSGDTAQFTHENRHTPTHTPTHTITHLEEYTPDPAQPGAAATHWGKSFDSVPMVVTRRGWPDINWTHTGSPPCSQAQRNDDSGGPGPADRRPVE